MFPSDLPLKYLWEEQRYEAALLETNDDKLRTRIATALDSMNRRLIALKPKESACKRGVRRDSKCTGVASQLGQNQLVLNRSKKQSCPSPSPEE